MNYHDRYFSKWCNKCTRFKNQKCNDVRISNDHIDNCINNNMYEEMR